MVDRASVIAWLDRYVGAWATNERIAIEKLFSEQAAYRYHPSDEPIVGAGAIADSWLESPDPPGSWRAHYEPVAVEADVAVVRGVSTYLEPGGSVARVYDNQWLLRFDPDGLCREFTEWYVKRS